MSEHPIEGLMKTAMESIKDMVDVNTVVGDPVETPDGNVIIPISRVTAGFAAGGSDFEGSNDEKKKDVQEGNNFPFGGGSGAGVSVHPMGFLVVGQGQIRLIPVDGNVTVDRIIDVAPTVFNQVAEMFGRGKHKENDKEHIEH